MSARKSANQNSSMFPCPSDKTFFTFPLDMGISRKRLDVLVGRLRKIKSQNLVRDVGAMSGTDRHDLAIVLRTSQKKLSDWA